jgi:anaerobic selenocysteine-containing dehydrogenase
VAEQITDYQLPAMVYLEREPFHINWYGPQTQAILNRSDRWEWHNKGRQKVQPGHPFLLFKVKPT